MKHNRIARHASVVMALILLSRLLGFIRERALADVFGLNVETDLFRLAFNIPDLMYFLLIAGGLNAAFIPVFTSYLASEEEEQAWAVATTFFTVIGGALLASVVLGVVFTPQLTPLVAYGYTGETKQLLVTLMRLMFPAVFFTALAGAAMGVHKSYQRFGSPMWGPIAYNAVIIVAIYVAGASHGITAVAIGTVIGAVANFFVQLPFLWRQLRKHAYVFQLKHPGLQRIFRLMGPAVISLSVFQINFIILSNLASGLAPGSPTALRVGQTVVQLPLGVFAMAISTVILPTLSALAAQNNMEQLRDTFSKSLRAVFFITIPSSVGLFVLRVPVVRLLFETGAFTADDTQMAAFTLGFLTVGLWAQAGAHILTQVFYSLHQTRALMRISIIAFGVNTGLAVFFLKFTDWGVGALALAYALTALVNMINYTVTLRRTLGRIDGRRIVKTVVTSGIASGLMAVAVYAFDVKITSSWAPKTFFHQFIALGTTVAIGAIVYAAIAFLLRMEEMHFLCINRPAPTKAEQ